MAAKLEEFQNTKLLIFCSKREGQTQRGTDRWTYQLIPEYPNPFPDKKTLCKGIKMKMNPDLHQSPKRKSSSHLLAFKP